MARFIKAQKESIGLSPDTIKFIGEKQSDLIKFELFDFDEQTLKEIEIKNINEAKIYVETATTTWLNIYGLHNEKIMEQISKTFNLDSLIIPDVLNTEERPKIQEYNDCIYISVKMLRYNESKNQILSENLVLIIKENILISFQEKPGDVFEPIRNRLKKNKKRIRTSPTDYLAFTLLDVVIDNYIYVISRIGEKIESLDEELIINPSNSTLRKINKYKFEIIYLRKSIKPCIELILNFIKMDSKFLRGDIAIHLKELQDNIFLANDLLDSYREVLANQLSLFHTNTSNKLNDILKLLTIFSVIFIPLTFITSVYGTNFNNIPELNFKYGYYAMWGVILVITILMISYFKKKKWF